MKTNKFQSISSEQSEQMTSCCSSGVSQVRDLIQELMGPRTVLIRKIAWTQMLPVSRDEFGGYFDDWWPDYTIYSPAHAITDMNGLLVYTQDALKGMPNDLELISAKFQSTYKKSKLNTRDRRNRNRVINGLIKDIIIFVTNVERHCRKMLDKRRAYYEQASLSKDTADRVQLKIFDEQSFIQLQTSMRSLEGFVQNFISLFVAEAEAEVDAEIGAGEKKGMLQDPLAEPAPHPQPLPPPPPPPNKAKARR
ncbi:uncharacterized protein LOC111070481 [Drosophila obscura]|uniref:uncharacterized protein LOC111070481 n=1 Tax=Drosophila obscura TaxID=7282 RepID=UPI001BB10774|nr:uncharacterized protein LOC111070481 [Drosophila obscura]